MTEQSGFIPIQDVTGQYLQRLELSTSPESCPTGFIDLDRLLGGLYPGDLIVLGGVPALGKSDFVLNIALNVSFKFNRKVAFFSSQNSRTRLAERVLSLHSGVSSSRIREVRLNEAELKHITRAAQEISFAPLFINDTPNLLIQELRAQALALSENNGLNLLVIDSIKDIIGTVKQKQAPISQLIKSLARELAVPILAVSQLTRGVDRRADHTPVLSDLMGGRVVEDAADVVLLGQRQDLYDYEIEKLGIVEFIVAKNRNGPLGKVSLGFDGRTGQFVSLVGVYDFDDEGNIMGPTP